MLRTPLMLLVAVLSAACATPVATLPTEEAAAAAELPEPPPLYQLLYDAPVLPETQASLQRVRILLWLVQLDLSTAQLDQLELLRLATAERRASLAAAEQAAAERWETEERAVYDTIFEAVRAGTPLDGAELAPQVDALAALRDAGRDAERLRLRVEAMTATIESMDEFQRSLTQTQENMIADALFFLRSRLDPIGNPGDFQALVGSTYEPGQYAVLTRGTGAEALKPLNIGGLWSDEPGLTGRTLHNAQREVLLYLALLEPGLEDAIAAARDLRETPSVASP
ncbi:MAG: hypothetical protein ACI8S6_000402 [Myxococcota bacterium]|jgi:hypothetical protein